MMQKSLESSSNCHNKLEWKQMQENARLVRLDGARGRGRKGYVGVRQRASGRWVAEIKDSVRNIRVWLGTFDTSEEAARAYDEAACILRGAKTRTNFWPRSTSSDTKPALPSKISTLLFNRLGVTSNDDANGGLSVESSYDTIQQQGHETRDTFQISLNTSNQLSNGFDYAYSRNEVKRLNDFDLETSWTESEREGSEGKEAKKPRITDYLSLDAIKPTSAAQGMSSGSMKTNPTDKFSMLSESTDRMKYERSNSASLYGFNEISECLELKLGTGDANSTYDSYHSWNLEENPRPDEKNDAFEAIRVSDKQQTSNVLNYSSSNSASSSASIDGNELSLWSSLNLPPITVLFGAQLPSISF